MSKNYNFTPFNYGPPKSQQQNQKTFNYSSVPPTQQLTGSRQSNNRPAKASYTPIETISQHVMPSQYGSKKRAYVSTEENYFEDDDETLEYIPAENSPSAKRQESSDDSDQEDPLDAFMANLEKSESKPKPQQSSNTVVKPSSSQSQQSIKGVRADIDDMDDEESYYKYMEENPMAGVVDENSGDELEYDEDGNPIPPMKKKFIDPLPPIDHSEITYTPFEKNFYVIHDEISALSRNQINDLRHKLGIRVSGAAAPAPVCSFAHFNFDETLMKAIRKSEYVSVSFLLFCGELLSY